MHPSKYHHLSQENLLRQELLMLFVLKAEIFNMDILIDGITEAGVQRKRFILLQENLLAFKLWKNELYIAKGY